MDLLKAQVVLKGIITLEEWDEMKTHIQFDYVADNYFTELKEIEIRNERMNQVNVMDPYVGKYFSVEYMRRQVLKQTDQEMIEIDKQIEEAFMNLAGIEKCFELGLHMRDTVGRHTGIPISIGIAKTKTLAKVANHCAKRFSKKGVYIDRKSVV